MTWDVLRRATKQEETQGPGHSRDLFMPPTVRLAWGAWRVGPVTDHGPVSTCMPRTISLLELGVW